MIDPRKALAAAVGDAGIRIICQGAGDAGALCQQLFHTGDLAAAAGQGDTVFRDVAHQLGRGVLQYRQHLIGDLFGKTVQNCLGIGMGVCMTLASVLNIRMINKIISPKIKIGKSIFLISVLSIPVASITSFLTNILVHFVPLFINIAISCSVGAVFFLLLCQIFDLIDIKIWVASAKEKVSEKFLKRKLHKS